MLHVIFVLAGVLVTILVPALFPGALTILYSVIKLARVVVPVLPSVLAETLSFTKRILPNVEVSDDE